MVLYLKLLDDHRDALKVREGEVSDFCRRMEELSAAGQTATEEISRLKKDLSHEVAAHSNREEKVA